MSIYIMGALDRFVWPRAGPSYDSLACDDNKLASGAETHQTQDHVLLEHQYKTQYIHSHWRSAFLYTLVFILTVCLCVISTAYIRLVSQTAPVRSLHCGEKVGEAMAASRVLVRHAIQDLAAPRMPTFRRAGVPRCIRGPGQREQLVVMA